MGALQGRIVAVTGAGRGLGREHALLLAAEGAAVVVNDLGGAPDGSGSDVTAAQAVVDEITAAGGRALASTDDITTEDGAEALVAAAVDGLGGLDGLVLNAGILRDRTIVSMSTDEWDDVIRVHLRGHFLSLRAAARRWRDRAKAGEAVAASVVMTSSTSGLFANPSQGNYAAAKSGIATLALVAHGELHRYGVRVNAVCPAGRTRLALLAPGMEEAMAPPADGSFDKNDPANVSPFVAYLLTEGCPLSGRVFFAYGGDVHLFQPWHVVDRISKDGRWTIEELAEAAPRLGEVPLDTTLPW